MHWSYTCSWGHKSGWAMLKLGWLLFQYASAEVFLGKHHPFQETGYPPAQNNQLLNHPTLRTSNKIELLFLMHVLLCLHSRCGSSLLLTTVVPGFRVLGFSALPGFKALKAGNRAWSVHKTLFGFKAPTLGSWLRFFKFWGAFAWFWRGFLLEFGVFSLSKNYLKA